MAKLALVVSFHGALMISKGMFNYLMFSVKPPQYYTALLALRSVATATAITNCITNP